MALIRSIGATRYGARGLARIHVFFDGQTSLYKYVIDWFDDGAIRSEPIYESATDALRAADEELDKVDAAALASASR
jgi:hypothetical protein